MNPMQVPAPANTMQQNQPHVLVVDDEANNRTLLNRILRRQAHIMEAANGREALSLLESERFDLVLLDIMMPDVSGFDVLKTIRSTPEISDLPVILISALSETDDIVRGLQMQANDYIIKPIDIDVVLARVETQLKLKMMMDIQKQSIAELQAAQQMKDHLFNIASHDLRSPLAGVLLAQMLLREYVQDQPDALMVLDTLQVTVDKMTGIIEEFLDMAACQSGKIDVRLGRVDVERIVAGVIAQYSITAHDKNIALEAGQLSGAAHADPTRLEQVLNNLVSNAVKYSPRDTTVTLWSEVRGDKVRIYVADEGPGIPAHERERLFTEFGKLSNRPTGGEASTGLGLWIVRHIVTLQKGTVGVECPADGGSIFWVELPVYNGH